MQDPEFVALAAAAELRATYRANCGAVEIHIPGVSIRVEGDREADAPRLGLHMDVHTPAQKLVAEMMILAGEVAGRYGVSPFPPNKIFRMTQHLFAEMMILARAIW